MCFQNHFANKSKNWRASQAIYNIWYVLYQIWSPTLRPHLHRNRFVKSRYQFRLVICGHIYSYHYFYFFGVKNKARNRLRTFQHGCFTNLQKYFNDKPVSQHRLFICTFRTDHSSLTV